MGHNPMLVESMTLRRGRDIWNDYVMIFAADADAFTPPARPLLSDTFDDAMNIRRYDSDKVSNFTSMPEDMQIVSSLRKRVKRLRGDAQAGVPAVAAE